MLTTFLSAKALAVFVGPPGIALLGQLTNIASIFMTISTAGISNGVTKYVAEKSGEPKQAEQIILNAVKLSLLASVVSGLLLFLLSKYLSTTFLFTSDYRIVFLIFGCTILFYSLNQLIISIINGYKEYKKYIFINIVINIISLLFTLILVYLYNIKGALIAYVSSQSVIFFITLLLIRKETWLKNILLNRKEPINYKIIKDLSGFTLITIVSAIFSPLSFVLVRNHIVSSISLQDAGIWEALNRISNLYLMLITSSIAVYFIPKISALQERALIKKEVIQTYKVLIPLCLLIATNIFLFRTLIIKVLFTPEFLQIEKLMPFQLMGDVFKIASWILTYFMIAKRLLGIFIFMEVSFCTTYVLLNYHLINTYGLMGSTFAYLINYMVYFLVAFLLIRKFYFEQNQKISL